MALSFAQLRVAEPTPTARRLLWHLFSIGRAWRDEPEAHAAQDKAGVFLFRIVSGRGALLLPDAQWELAPGPRCWWVDMGRPRTYAPAPGCRLVTTGFRFSGPGLDAWREALGGGGEFRFGSAAAMAFLPHAQRRLLRLVTQRPARHEWAVHETLTLVLGKLLAARGVFAGREAPPPAPVRRVLDAVLAAPARAWRAAELAGLARVSYSGLRAIFRASQHGSLHDFLRRTRLDQARRLLADERLTVKEVAQRLDFSSEFYFSHWFRRNAGVAPSGFRRAARG